MTEQSHDQLIREQFTLQAKLFSAAAPITDERALTMIRDAAQPSPDDRLLDVACGGGILTCALAPFVSEVVGIDMTRAMLAEAKALAAKEGLRNIVWREGDARALPFAERSFGVVVTRFSFHHFPDPSAVLSEMVRVCAPGGRIVVVDVIASEDRAKAALFNRLERLRDPSHARALSLAEHRGLFLAAGLGAPRESFYELSDEVSNLLARSFPKPGDEREILGLFEASAEDGRLGIPVRREGEKIHYSYPVAILAALRPPA
jgi:ubiquinone/menaquinone biosynthesis C-methylase UbiE